MLYYASFGTVSERPPSAVWDDNKGTQRNEIKGDVLAIPDLGSVSGFVDVHTIETILGELDSPSSLAILLTFLDVFQVRLICYFMLFVLRLHRRIVGGSFHELLVEFRQHGRRRSCPDS